MELYIKIYKDVFGEDYIVYEKTITDKDCVYVDNTDKILLTVSYDWELLKFLKERKNNIFVINKKNNIIYKIQQVLTSTSLSDETKWTMTIRFKQVKEGEKMKYIIDLDKLIKNTINDIINKIVEVRKNKGTNFEVFIDTSSNLTNDYFIEQIIDLFVKNSYNVNVTHIDSEKNDKKMVKLEISWENRN